MSFNQSRGTYPKFSTACPDWEKRIVAGESLIPFQPLFPEQAEYGLDVFKSLVLVDVLGQPTIGEANKQWLFDFAGSIFGAYDESSGRRLITEIFMLISKKNGKSTNAGALMLSMLVWNWRESAEFLILAPTVEIANNSFWPARDMVKADDDLNSLMHVQNHIRTITHRKTGATLKVVAADSETVGGKKATGILVDEAWIFGKKSGAENMFREACGGLASRPEGFVIWLSTQSDEAPAGVFKQKLQYARDVRDGKIDDSQFLPILYEFPKDMIKKGDHLKRENFYVTNPNLNASVDEAFLIREFKKAENDGPASMAGFLSKHLNIEMDITLKETRWAGAPFWKDAGGGVTLDFILENSEVVVIGIDGGGLDDLLGLAVLGREEQRFDENDEPLPQKWFLWNKAWCHPIALERRKQFAPMYRDFEKDGDLTIVSEIGVDVREACDIVERCEETELLDTIGVDAHGIVDILEELEHREFDLDRVKSVPQGWRLSGAIKTAGRKVAEKTMVHGSQPLMNWCVGNAMGVMRGNAESITKEHSGTGKIDPLMATFNCVALMGLNPEAKTSIYSRMSKKDMIERMKM